MEKNKSTSSLPLGSVSTSLWCCCGMHWCWCVQSCMKLLSIFSSCFVTDNKLNNKYVFWKEKSRENRDREKNAILIFFQNRAVLQMTPKILSSSFIQGIRSGVLCCLHSEQRWRSRRRGWIHSGRMLLLLLLLRRRRDISAVYPSPVWGHRNGAIHHINHLNKIHIRHIRRQQQQVRGHPGVAPPLWYPPTERSRPWARFHHISHTHHELP